MTPTTQKREHFASIRREVVQHRMVMSECAEDRLFWGMILWSWCGPQRSDDGAILVKNPAGFIQVDGQGKPIPAKLKDLRELMGWPEGMKGEVTRMVQRLIAKGSLRFDKQTGTLYAIEEPSPQKIPKAVAGTRKWNIGRLVVGTRNLPADPAARERAIQWLDTTHDAFNQQLGELRTRYREMLVQAAPELGIIIVFKEKKSRRDKAAAAPSPVVEEAAADPLPQSPNPSPQPETPLPQKAPIPLLAEELGIDHGAAGHLLADCTAAEPSVTVPEIVEKAQEWRAEKRSQIEAGMIKSPTGLLIRELPRRFKNGELQELRRRKREQEARERARIVSYHRELWSGYTEQERAEVVAEYAELRE